MLFDKLEHVFVCFQCSTFFLPSSWSKALNESEILALQNFVLALKIEPRGPPIDFFNIHHSQSHETLIKFLNVRRFMMKKIT